MTAGGRSSRLAWIDIAKGICIILVVLGHSVDWYMRAFTGGKPIALVMFTAALQPLRMPLFFAISGMLAASNVKRPLRDIWSKTAGLYILYCIWTAAYCVKLMLPGGRDGLDYPPLHQLALAFLLPVQLWYIWALPVFYVIAWALERIPRGRGIYALLPMACLAVAANWIGQVSEFVVKVPFDAVHFEGVAFNLLWFYLGLKGKPLWITVVASHRLWRLAIALLLYASTVSLTWHFDMVQQLAILSTPFALWTAMELLGWVRPELRVWRAFGIVGKHTLPIYLMHTFALTAMTLVVRLVHLDRMILYGMQSFEIALPLAVTAILTVLCLLAGKILAATPLRFLVEPMASPFARTNAQDGTRKSGSQPVTG